jgi:hypothetical protein
MVVTVFSFFGIRVEKVRVKCQMCKRRPRAVPSNEEFGSWQLFLVFSRILFCKSQQNRTKLIKTCIKYVSYEYDICCPCRRQARMCSANIPGIPVFLGNSVDRKLYLIPWPIFQAYVYFRRMLSTSAKMYQF